MPMASIPFIVLLNWPFRSSERPILRGADAGSVSFYCCGVRIDTRTQELAASEILAAGLEHVPLSVHFCNAYTLSLASDDRDFGARLDLDDLNLPDGMPLYVWIAQELGMHWLTKRVYGPRPHGRGAE